MLQFTRQKSRRVSGGHLCVGLGCSGGLQPPEQDQLKRTELMNTSVVPIGQTFSRLTVLSKGTRKDYWLCQCACGSAPKEISRYHVRKGTTRSCGCLQREKQRETFLTHGAAQKGKRSRGYAVWASMLQRCTNIKNKNYPQYGGRGIKVCSSWESFQGFIACMGEPQKGESLERLDVNGDYSQENCVWVDLKVQNQNKRNNRLLTYAGRTQCMAAWAEEFGIPYSTLRSRLRYGWNIEKALNTVSAS